MWWDIIKRLKTTGKTLTGFKIEDVNEERPEVDDDDDCNRQLKAYVDKAISKTNIDLVNQGISYRTWARDSENKYEPIPEPVACFALKLIKDFNYSDVENGKWGHCDSNGNKMSGNFFADDSEWTMIMINHSRGGSGRIDYDILGRKYAILEFELRDNKRAVHDNPIEIKIYINAKQGERTGGIPRSEAIGDLDYMRKYADWRN